MRTPSRPTALSRMLGVMPTIGIAVSSIRRRDKSLADQLARAAQSVALNLAEAQGSDPGNARARLHTALGSAKEARVALTIAVAFAHIAADPVLDDALDHVAALTYRRLYPAHQPHGLVSEPEAARAAPEVAAIEISVRAPAPRGRARESGRSEAAADPRPRLGDTTVRQRAPAARGSELRRSTRPRPP